MKHIKIALAILIVPELFLGILLWQTIIEIELFSALSVIIIAVSGYIYQSGENKRLQDLQYKREIYANLMAHLSIFKASREKEKEEKRELTKIYWRSWTETSDEVNDKLLKYFEAYRAWTKDKTNKKAENKEIRSFNKLTNQIKKEINPKSTKKFKEYIFN